MKYLAYVLFLAAPLHAFGCLVGGTPRYLFMSVLIAVGGVLALRKSKGRNPVAGSSESIACDGPAKPKAPFYKNWILWWCFAAFLLLVGSIDKNTPSNDSDSTKSTNRPPATATRKKEATSWDARQYTERHLTSRYGRVAELSSVNNGSYFGFPTGNSVYTFAGTVLVNNIHGGPPSRNVIIAVEFDGHSYSVAKIQVD